MRAGDWVAGVQRRLVGRAPAAPAGRRVDPTARPEAMVRGVLELALRVGEAMLSLGADAADVTDAVRRLCRAFRLEVQVDLTFTSLQIAFDPGPSHDSVSVLRVVQTRTSDYGRLTDVTHLAYGLAQEEGLSLAGVVDPDEQVRISARLEQAHRDLDDIITGPHPYRRAMVTLMLAAMAGGVAVLLGGGVIVTLLAAASAAVLDVVVWFLGRWGLPAFFTQMVGAAIVTVVAVLLLSDLPWFPDELTQLPPSLVVASGIVVLLAGMSFVGAANDAINGFPITAGGRLTEVVLLTLGIAVGIGGVLDAARRSGVTLQLVDLPPSAVPVAVQILAGGVVAGMWALASYSPPRTALLAAVAGALAWGVYSLARDLGVGAAVASGVAALVVGFGAEAVSGRMRVPSVVTSVCGIVPLLPGLAIYRGMLALVESDVVDSGASLLLEAALIALALAAGVTLGEFLARRVGAAPRRVLLPGYVRARRRRAPRASRAGTAATTVGSATSTVVATTTVVTTTTSAPVPDDLTPGPAPAAPGPGADPLSPGAGAAG